MKRKDGRSARTDVYLIFENVKPIVTPLEYAIINYDKSPDSLAIIEKLLKNGAKPNFSEPQLLFNPLILASSMYDDQTSIKILKTILQSSDGVLIDQPDRFGLTPLAHACMQNKLETVVYLLYMGANPKHRSSFNDTPIDYTKDYDPIYNVFKKKGLKKTNPKSLVNRNVQRI